MNNSQIRSQLYSNDLILLDSIRRHVVKFIFNYNSQRTRDSYVQDIGSFFTWYSKRSKLDPGKVNLKEITDYHFIVWKNFLRSKYSTRTVNRKLSSLSEFFKFLYNDKIIAANPLDRIKRLPQPKNFETPDLGDDIILEGIELVKKSKNLRHIVIVLIFVFTGMRCEEGLKLKFSDIEQINGDYYFRVKGKGEKDRLIYIQKDLLYYIECFKRYIILKNIQTSNLIDQVYLIQSRDSLTKILTEKNSKTIQNKKSSVVTVYSVLEKYFKHEKIKVRPHMIRTTVIGKLVESGKSSIVEVGELMGHSSIETTNKYFKRKVSLEKNAARNLKW